MSLTVAQIQSLLVFLAVTGTLTYWFRSWRRARTPGLLAMVKALAALDLALLLGLDHDHEAWLFGIATLPNYLLHLVALLAAYWLQVFVLHLAHPTSAIQAKARIRTRLVIGAQLALLILYLLGPVHGDRPAINGETGNHLLAVLYLAVFEIYVGIAMFDIFHVARHAQQLPRGYLRTGLRLFRWGGLAGLGFVVEKLLYSLALALGISSAAAHTVNGVAAGLLTSSGILLLMAGATIPAVGPRNRMRREYRQLEPLWRDLTAFAPEVKFGARSPHRADITDRIRQRLTEINDVLIGPLQPYLDPAVHAAALASAEQKAGHGAVPDAAATAQAVTIATALISTEPVNPNKPVVFTTPGTKDYRDEAAWYASVATAYTHLIATAKTEEPRRHAVDPAR